MRPLTWFRDTFVSIFWLMRISISSMIAFKGAFFYAFIRKCIMIRIWLQFTPFALFSNFAPIRIVLVLSYTYHVTKRVWPFTVSKCPFTLLLHSKVTKTKFQSNLIIFWFQLDSVSFCLLLLFNGHAIFSFSACFFILVCSLFAFDNELILDHFWFIQSNPSSKIFLTKFL